MRITGAAGRMKTWLVTASLNVPFHKVKVLICGSEAATKSIDVVVKSDKDQPGPSLLHLGRQRPFLGVRVEALHAGSVGM